MRGLCRLTRFNWGKGNGRASGYCALYSGLEDRRVSLNTYARYAELGTMLEMKLESRAGFAPTWTVLQTAAWAARPTGHSNVEVELWNAGYGFLHFSRITPQDLF